MLPRLLDSSLNIVRRIEPLGLSLDLSITPLSTATIDLVPGETIPARSWVQIFYPDGTFGIYRSRPVQDRYGDRSVTVELEHGIAEVGDWTVQSNASEQLKAANQAITTIFGDYGGTAWALGTLSCTDNVVFETSMGDSVLEAIEKVMDQCPGYMLTFDQTSSPWTVSVSARPGTVSAEGRLSRNIESVKITRDDSEQCNRVYIDGMSGHLDDLTSQAAYGIIEHRMQETGLSATVAAKVAQNYLDAHKDPKLSVELSAVDLSDVTGETLDAIKLGKKYRLAIPEDGITIEQTVSRLRYDDLLGNPQSVSVTISEDPADVVAYLKKQRRGGGTARRNQERTNERFTTRFIQEEAKIGLVVEEKDGQNVIRSASIVAAINNDESSVKISADHITLDGYATAQALVGQYLDVAQINTEEVDVDGSVVADYLQGDTGYIEELSVDEIEVPENKLKVGSTYYASWKSMQVVTAVGVSLPSITRSAEYKFATTQNDVTVYGSVTGRIITGYSAGSVNPSTDTIYYLGRTVSS